MNKSQKLLFKLENMNIFFFSKQKGRHSTKRLNNLMPINTHKCVQITNSFAKYRVD